MSWMKTPSREDRFAEAVAAELQNGTYRGPIWDQAFTVAKGDEAKARDLYTAMRVQQMEQDEAAQVAAREAKVQRERLNDAAVPPRIGSKLLLLALIALLFAALAYVVVQMR